MNPKDAVAKLNASKMSDRRIAAAINVSPNTIGRIRKGVCVPSYETGKKLVDMAYHAEIYKEKSK